MDSTIGTARGSTQEVVTTLSSDRRLLTLAGHSILFSANRASWLESHTNNNILSIGDASLHSATSVRASPGPPILIYIKFIIVIITGQKRASESRSNLKTLRGG